MTTLDISMPPAAAKRALVVAGLLLAAELFAIGTFFKHGANFTCLDNWPQRACAGASFAMVGLYCAIAALILLITLRPAPFASLSEEAGRRFWPLGINICGTGIAFLPAFFLSEGRGTAVLVPAFFCWAIGMTVMLSGLALFIAPLHRWRSFLAAHWGAVGAVLLVGLAAPYLAALLRPVWRIDFISDVTFEAVAFIVAGLGYAVETYPEHKIIGAGDFFIDVAPQCSGIEGIALVTLFVTIYLSLFRRDLLFPRAFLLYPIGIATSAVFNVIRIAILLILGIEGNPELAVGGFHSHAGWLMFTLIALGIVALAKSVPMLQKEPVATGTPTQTGPLPLRQDPVVAAILPFALFMLSAVFAQAFSQTPSLIYPARVLVMAGVLALFWQLYLRLPWRIDYVAVGVGGLIGAAWVMIPVADEGGAAPYGALTGAALLGWFLLRGAGTVLLVPLIEELFFRSYLESRLRLGPGIRWKVMAALITATLFAALHDRWVEAFLAGLLFSWVAQRRGNITDAIIAHAVANFVVFSVAWVTGQIHII